MMNGPTNGTYPWPFVTLIIRNG